MEKNWVNSHIWSFKTISNPRVKDLYEYIGYVLNNGAKDAGRVRAIALIIKRCRNEICDLKDFSRITNYRTP
jgi:hypothetical protein